MTSRERIIAAIEHKETDRIPIDFGGHRSSGIAVQAYLKLRRYIGLPASPLYIYDVIQQLAVVEEDVLDYFGADVVCLGYDYYKNPSYWKDWELEDGTPCKIPSFIELVATKEGTVVYGKEGKMIAIQKKGCLYFEQTCYPLQDKLDDDYSDLEEKMQDIMWVSMGGSPAPDDLMTRKEGAIRLRQSTDRGIYGAFGGNLMEHGGYCFGMDKFFIQLAAEPKKMHKFLDALTENHMRNLDIYLDTVGDSIDILGFGDDLGMQSGPLVSPKMYREFFKPRHKALWMHAKKRYPRLKISLHTCGGIYPIIEDLIDAGLDTFNPVQITCKDMDPEKLKKDFGKEMCFWGGGCDTRFILPKGSIKEIKEHVQKNIEVFAKGSGFVFQQVHNILADVPPQNIVAMFDAVKEFAG